MKTKKPIIDNRVFFYRRALLAKMRKTGGYTDAQLLAEVADRWRIMQARGGIDGAFYLQTYYLVKRLADRRGLGFNIADYYAGKYKNL